MSDPNAPRRSCRQPDNAKPDADLCSKRCNVHPFELPCDYCGAPVTVTWASRDVVQPACSGCFGYPMCICREAHRGECPERKEPKGFEAFRDQEELMNHALSVVMKETLEVIARAPSSFFIAQFKSDDGGVTRATLVDVALLEHRTVDTSPTLPEPEPER